MTATNRGVRGKVCTIEGCSNVHHAKGFCGKHYWRHLFTGTVEGRRIDRPVRRLQMICVQCSQAFETRKNLHFCSVACRNTSRRAEAVDPVRRFIRKIVVTDTCWVWTGFVASDGYGWFAVRPGAGGRPAAHRFSYEAFVGPIPQGLQLDHLCCVRSCVRPDHLEPVTPRENVLRAHRPGYRIAQGATP